MNLEYRVVVRNDEPIVERVITLDDGTEQAVADSGRMAVLTVGRDGAADLMNELRQLVNNRMSGVDINSDTTVVFAAGHFLNRAGLIMQDLATGIRELP